MYAAALKVLEYGLSFWVVVDQKYWTGPMEPGWMVGKRVDVKYRMLV